MLWGMSRSWLRRIFTPFLGLAVALSMSVSAMQATEVPTGMTMATVAGVAADDGKCTDCDQGNRDKKANDCRLAICGMPGIATLVSAFAVVDRPNGRDLPVPPQSSLVGWAHAPDPHPPRLRTLG